jgi:IS30 family transposase
MTYKHLTLEQRYTIQTLFKQGIKQNKIAQSINVHPSTISRELKRNANKNLTYHPKTAQDKAKKRAANRQPYKMKGKLKAHIISKLNIQWSPEQISHTLPENLVQQFSSISHEAIYLYIHKDSKQGGELYKNLRWQRKKRRKRLITKDKRGKIKNAVNISQRLQIVENKQRIGDWEADTVVLKNHKGCLLTLVERKTKYLITALLPNRRSDTITQAIIERFSRTSLPVLTITYDNGKEFSGHEKVNKVINCSSYFCDPYSSWQRGLNENTNGLIRQYIPKNQSFEETTWQQLRTATNRINNRPRKTLNFQTPFQLIKNFN